MVTEKRIRSFITLISVLLFIYVSSRAYLVSFTTDECYTYLHYVRGTWANIYQVTYTNNHLLNSWLMKWCSLLFGTSEFSLRLPNVLSYLLFLYYGAQLLFKLKDKWIILAGFLFLNLNPFVLDFFSLARGYGISMGLMMMSIYYLYSLFYFDRSVKNILLAFLAMSLAVLANLTMINLLIAIVLLTIAASLFPGLSPRVNGIVWKRNRWKIVIVPVIALATFGWYVIPMLMQLQNAGNFDFGGDNGFWSDTVNSLIGNSFYGTHFWDSPSFDLREVMILSLFFIYYLIEFMIIGVVINYSFKKLYFLYTNRSIRPEGFIWFLFMMLLLCFVAIMIQHHFFHIPFSVDRAAIYFIPLFSIFFIFWMDSIRSTFSKKIWVSISAVIPLVLFIPSINFNYCHWWRFDAGINELMFKLNLDTQVDFERNFIVGMDPKYRSQFNYYRLEYDLLNFDPSNETDICENGSFDYYLVSSDDRSKYEGKLIASFPISEISLIASEVKAKGRFTKQFPRIDYEDTVLAGDKNIIEDKLAYDGRHIELTNERHNFAKNFIDTIQDAKFLSKCWIYHELMLKRTNENAEGALVISLKRDGKIVFWREVNIREFVLYEDEWTKVRSRTSFPKDIQNGDILQCFFWNQSKYDIYVDQQYLQFYQTTK